MKVLLVTPHYPPEIRSVSVLMSQLAEDLAARGHAVTVLAPYPPSHVDEAPARPSRVPPDSVRVIRVAALPFVKVPRAVRAVTHVTLAASMVWSGLRAGRHDAVLVYSPPLPLALAAEVLARRRRVPLVVNVQDIYPQALIDLGLARNPVVLAVLRWLESRAYRRAAALTVHSDGNRRLLVARGVDPGKILVIPNWVDLDDAAPPDPNPYRVELDLGERTVVLFAGVMGYAQDMSVIVEAARVLRDDPTIVFLLAGDGVRRAEAEALVRERGLTNVRFLPFQPIERYPTLVAAADCCLVTLEASVATPVVPSKIAGILGQSRPLVAALPPGDAREIVDASGGGVCVDPGDAAALAGAIRELAADPARRRAMGGAGRRYVEAHFSRRASTAAYAALVERLVAPARAGMGAGAANSPKRP